MTPGRITVSVVMMMTLAVGEVNEALSASKTPLRKHESVTGGYTVRMPEGWDLAEETIDGSYRGTWSPAEGSAGTDFKGLTLTVRRTAEYRELFPIDYEDFDRTAQAYAGQVAKNRARSGQGVLVDLKRSIPGMRSGTYSILAGLNTDQCTTLWLVVGIKDGSGFEASWEIPCSAAEPQMKRLAEIVGSLRVKKNWGKSGA